MRDAKGRSYKLLALTFGLVTLICHICRAAIPLNSINYKSTKSIKVKSDAKKWATKEKISPVINYSNLNPVTIDSLKIFINLKMSSSLSFLSRLSPLVLAVQHSDHGSSNPACSKSPLITTTTASKLRSRDLLNNSCQQTSAATGQPLNSDLSISSSFCANCECNHNHITLLREENDRLRHALQEVSVHYRIICLIKI